jgi:hypothetical protein
MNLASYIIGTHLWFFREGDAFTLPAPGAICGQESKPGIAPDMDPEWVDMGAVESFDPTVSQEDTKLFRPAPGRLVLKDVLENKQELTIKAVTNDVGGLAVETLFRASAKLSGAVVQFNPLSAISRRGWVHAQCYDQDNSLWLTLDLWCRLRTTAKFDGTPTKPEWEMFMLYSSLNTGAIV